MLYELRDVKKRFSTKEILSIESLSFEAGGIIGIAGPNGSGKSTMLEILSGLQRQTQGVVNFNGSPISEESRKKIVMVLQNPVMFNMSVFDNVAYGLKARGLKMAEYAKLVERELEFFDLLNKRNRNAKTLSGGEKQKLAIARASVLDPEVLILDEPTSGLDFTSVLNLRRLIQKLYESNPKRTIFVASHDKDFLHLTSQRTYVILEKKIHFESIENFYHGKVTKKGVAKINENLSIFTSAENEGDVNIIISPENIVLSKESLDSSMRNSLKGRIAKITHQNGVKDILVWVDIGAEICCKITEASYRKMGLGVGDSLWVSFKATSVKLFYKDV